MDQVSLSGLEYRQADVFAPEPLCGNGLCVFFDDRGLSGPAMQALTREMRQFESIFLRPGEDPERCRARIFTMEEELDFAGHPVLGAVCALHERLGGAEERRWTLELNLGDVPVRTRRAAGAYEAEMDQGRARIEPPLDPERADAYLAAMNLRPEDREPGLPLQVVSTGLPYLILPVRAGLLERTRVAHADLEPFLAEIGARFAYVLDVSGLEGRTWDNAGRAEDAATGSAAGPVGAYLAAHGRVAPGSGLTLHQGRFVRRPSELCVRVDAEGSEFRVRVAGRVFLVASGRFD